MTEWEILFNYRQAIRQAEKLESLAKRLKSMSENKMENTVGTLKTVWRSDSSALYYNKVAHVQDEVTETSRKLQKIAQAIRETAEALKNAEMRALEIARDRYASGGGSW